MVSLSQFLCQIELDGLLKVAFVKENEFAAEQIVNGGIQRSALSSFFFSKLSEALST